MAGIRTMASKRRALTAAAIALFIAAAAIVININHSGGRNTDKSGYTGIAIYNTDEITAVFRQTLEHRSNSVRISFRAYTLDEYAVEETVGELVRDAFYESSDPKGGDYLRYQYGGYELKYSSSPEGDMYQYNVSLTPVCYTSIEQEDTVDTIVEDLLNTSDISPASPDLEKVRWVHDYICDTVAYDTVHKHQPGSNHIQSTAYGALYYHTALCQGYAVLAYRLLKELGVDVRIITGVCNASGKIEKHAWNIVKVDGLYYNMDVTLDDQDGSMDYFLKTDDHFEDTHTRDAEFMSEEFYTEYPMSEENYHL